MATYEAAVRNRDEGTSGSDAVAGDKRGSQFVAGNVRYGEAHTVGAAAIPYGGCDCILFSDDTVATIDFIEAGAVAAGLAVALPLAGRQWHAIGAKKVTAVTAAVTVVVGWYRKPVEAV